MRRRDLGESEPGCRPSSLPGITDTLARASVSTDCGINPTQIGCSQITRRRSAMGRSGFAAIVISAWLTTTAFAAQVSYYQLPAGAAPHDVAPAADGTVWYTGQRKGFLGRFDPKSGKNEEIP